MPFFIEGAGVRGCEGARLPSSLFSYPRTFVPSYPRYIYRFVIPSRTSRICKQKPLPVSVSEYAQGRGFCFVRLNLSLDLVACQSKNSPAGGNGDFKSRPTAAEFQIRLNAREKSSQLISSQLSVRQPSWASRQPSLASPQPYRAWPSACLPLSASFPPWPAGGRFPCPCALSRRPGS